MENEENVTQETVEVNVGALAMACRVIAACTERGAIKAEELSTVGQVFDYLRGFLPAPEAAPEAAPEEEVAAPDGVAPGEGAEEVDEDA